MAKNKVNTSELKNWIMFFVALGLLFGMYRRGDELGPWWTLIIGAMLSLTTLVVAVENIMTLFKRPGGGGKSNGTNPEEPERNSDNGRPTDPYRPERPSLRKRSRTNPSQVAVS